jgi:hypothetical protein
MENQHRQIKGYRELSAEEIALMNEIKSKGAELGSLVDKGEYRRHRSADRPDGADPFRGPTHFILRMNP